MITIVIIIIIIIIINTRFYRDIGNTHVTVKIY